MTLEDSIPKRLEHSIYILSLKEWNLDQVITRFLWNPLKTIGRKLKLIQLRSLLFFFLPVYILGTWALYSKAHIPAYLHQILPVGFALIGLLMVLKSFSERNNLILSWLLIIMNHFWVALAVSFNEDFGHIETYLYLSGIIGAGAIGLLCLRKITRSEKNIDLAAFHGHVFQHPRLAFIFFLSCLGLAGFPITPTFIGEDLIFSHVHENQFFLAVIISLSFVIDGLSVIRLYGRIFLGAPVKSPQETAYKSS
jgi:NADH-quinone oxidoreductase subunit L